MDDELYGIAYLQSKLNAKKPRVRTRYKYYDQKFKVRDLGISTPKSMRGMQMNLGWATKSVNAISDRLVFRKFENDYFNMGEIYSLNNQDVLITSAIKSALISSCSFIYIYLDSDGYPAMEVIDGANATGIVDTRTNMLKEGYAILDTNEQGEVLLDAYFTPGQVLYRPRGGQEYVIYNPCKYCTLVPIINDPTDTRPFGHSRISRACMDLIQSACRTMLRTEITAEYYSYPQKYLLGYDPKMKIPDEARMGMSISTMLTMSANKDGSSPTVGQFSQQSMAPHNEQLQTIVKAYCGETGLTADDLGFVSVNPSSAEAIESSHETLRLIAEKAQRDFSVGFINAGYIAACLRDNQSYMRNKVATTNMLWRLTFKPSASMMSTVGDGALKMNQAVEGFVTKDNLEKLTGIESDS